MTTLGKPVRGKADWVTVTLPNGIQPCKGELLAKHLHYFLLESHHKFWMVKFNGDPLLLQSSYHLETSQFIFWYFKWFHNTSKCNMYIINNVIMCAVVKMDCGRNIVEMSWGEWKIKEKWFNVQEALVKKGLLGFHGDNTWVLHC